MVEVFCGEGAMENLLYLILSQRGEVLGLNWIHISNPLGRSLWP